MVIHFSKTVLILQYFVFFGCITGCKNVHKASLEKPWNSNKPEPHFNWKAEVLNDQVTFQVYPLSDSVFSGQDLQFNLSFLNNGADTVSIFMGCPTLKILELQDNSMETRIKPLESQLNKRVIVSDFSEGLHPKCTNVTDSKLALNNLFTVERIFPFDSLSKTVTFEFNTRPGRERQFRLIYDTENFRLQVDTLKIEDSIPTIATGTIISAPFVIEILTPIIRE